MHYHLEIIMPPTDDVEAAVKEILAPFDENGDENDEDYSSRNAFWDFWNIGGRFSGRKLLALLGQERVDAFTASLAERKITVSSLRFGKPTLQPADQRGMVDAYWTETFPEAPIKQCPLFDHYKGDAGDVMLLCDTPKMMECNHIIIAGPDYAGKKLEARHMLIESLWNGVTHQKVAWDGTVSSALAEYERQLEHCKPEWAESHRPGEGWISVTVDYHS